jgi:hypothetical protein
MQIPDVGVLSPGYKTLSVLNGGAAQCCTFCAAESGACAAWSFVVASGECSLYGEAQSAVPAPGRIYGRSGTLTRRAWTTMPQWLTQVRAAGFYLRAVWGRETDFSDCIRDSTVGARRLRERSFTRKKAATALHHGMVLAPACHRFRCGSLHSRSHSYLAEATASIASLMLHQDPVSWTQGINGSMAAVNGLAPMRNCP